MRVHRTTSLLVALVIVAAAPAGAETVAGTDGAAPEAVAPARARVPSVYSLRSEIGIGFPAVQAGLTFDLYPVDWLSVGLRGGWLGEFIILGHGNAYGGGLTLGGRARIPFGFVVFHGLGGLAKYSKTDDPLCLSPWEPDNPDACASTTSKGTSLWLGAAVGALFNVRRVQMGPMLRYDYVAGMHVAHIVTINYVIGIPAS